VKHFLINLIRIIVIVANVFPVSAVFAYGNSRSKPVRSEVNSPRQERFSKPFLSVPLADIVSRHENQNYTPIFVNIPSSLTISKPDLHVKASFDPPIEPLSMWERGRGEDSSFAIPAWFIGDQSEPDVSDSDSDILPDWFTTSSFQIYMPIIFGNYTSQPLPLTTNRSIPESVLEVTLEGPDGSRSGMVASLGSPVGSGEIYTATVFNDSDETAYGAYFTVTWPSFFTWDGYLDEGYSADASLTLSPTVGANSAKFNPSATLDLAPNETVTFTFKLRATCVAESAQQARAGIRYNADDGSSPDDLNTGGLNITTGQANLVIRKDPDLSNVSTSDMGKSITWIVTVQNTGLGIAYDAYVTDTGGIGLSQPSGDLTPSAHIASLGINKKFTYTVVGTIEACNFTNVAQAAWTCGNAVGDATQSNPVSSTASAMFDLILSNPQVDVSGPETFDYCSDMTKTIYVTLTNNGGPVDNFYYDSNLEDNSFLNVITNTVPTTWDYNPATGIFSYTDGPSSNLTGFLPDQSENPEIVLSFDVSNADSVCTAGSGSISLTPFYSDICNNLQTKITDISWNYNYGGITLPTLDITKTAPAEVATGQTYDYEIIVRGDNPIQIDGRVIITDILPNGVLYQSHVKSTGNITQTGNTVYWDFEPGILPTFDEALTITVKVNDTKGVCPAGDILNNRITASADTLCSSCSTLTATTNTETIIINMPTGISASGGYNGSTQTCDTGITIFNHFDVSGSAVITWNGATYTDTLGLSGASSLTETANFIYQSNSFEVFVNNTDYSSHVTPIMKNDRFVVDLSPLHGQGALTQNMTVYFTYTLNFTDASLDNSSETFLDWWEFYMPNADSCAGNQSYNGNISVDIERGDLQASISPSILRSCQTNVAEITVSGAVTTYETSEIVVQFKSSTEQIQSVVAHNVFSYTGGLNGIPVTVTNDTDIGGGQGVITFTFEKPVDISSTGTIQFNVDVECSDTASWATDVFFASHCNIDYSDNFSQTQSYLEPNLTLFVTPIEYSVLTRDATWKFYIANSGWTTATDVVITNVFQGLSVIGYDVDDATGLSVTPLPVTSTNYEGDVTTGTVAFTFATLAPGEMRVITVNQTIGQCSPLNVWVDTAFDCFGELCGQPSDTVKYNIPRPYLLTNNEQTADLPMCDIGHLGFTVKNASPNTSLYEMVVTETLEALSIVGGLPITLTMYDENLNIVTQTIEFTPTEIISGNTTYLVWHYNDAPTSTTYPDGIFNDFAALNTLHFDLPIQTTCLPNSTPKSYGQAFAQGPCGQDLSYAEQAKTLKTLQPDLEVEKVGKGPGGTFGETIYASPNEQVVWKVTVENKPTDHSYVARQVNLKDIWPSNFELAVGGIGSPTGITHTVVTASRVITWHIGDMEKADIFDFYLTGTVRAAADACSEPTTNDTQLGSSCLFIFINHHHAIGLCL